MDTLLLVITGLAVTVAIGASTVAWRVTRADRVRRAARVTALAAAADVAAIRATMTTSTPSHGEGGGLADFGPASPLDVGIVDRAASPALSAPGLFGAAVPDSGSGSRQHRLLAAAAVVAVIVGGSAAVWLTSGPPPAGSTSSVAGGPLELVALGHERVDGQLTVSGLVQNPAAGAAVPALEAHVRVFDAAGILIGTRSTAVGTADLAPGQELPFRLQLGESSTAARYRVSFASRGTMLAHVDRRTNLPAAVTADAR